MRWQLDSSVKTVAFGQHRPVTFDRTCRVACAALAVAIGLIGIGTQTAQAVPIQNFDGVAGIWSLNSDGVDGDLVFSASFTTLLNGSPAGVVDTTIADFTIDATSGPGTYLFDPSSYLAGLVYDDGFGTAVFDLQLQSLTIVSNNSMTILGTIELDSNSSSEDFSPFLGLPGEILFTLNKPSGGPTLNNIIQNGGLVLGSGSFSASEVPEPSTLVIAGFALTAFVVTFRRRMRRRNS